MVTIAERPELLEAAYSLARDEGYADLALDGDVSIPLEEWLRDEATLPAGSFVALDRGRIVGFSGLMRTTTRASPRTGSRSSPATGAGGASQWRSSGASSPGLRRTASRGGYLDSARNEGMRKVNERLGYAYRTVGAEDDGGRCPWSRFDDLTDERKRTVEAGYDALADRFGEWMARVEGDPWERFVDELADRLPEGARVLDLGCGNGTKTARLADRFERDRRGHLRAAARARARRSSRGVLRPSRLRGARRSSREFRRGHRALLDRPRAPDEQPALFARILGWLKPGGLFLASLSHVGGEDRVDEWLGVDMFFSGFDADTNRRLVREAGFELIEDRARLDAGTGERGRIPLGAGEEAGMRRLPATTVYYGLELLLSMPRGS